jgi:hypothetical protein
MGPDMDHVVCTATAREPDDRYGSALALVTAARAARPWSGVDRRSSTRPLPVAAPPPPPPPAEPPARRRARPVPPLAAGVAALVTAGAAGVLLLAHRGGGTGAATAGHPAAAPTAAPPPGTPRLEAALLTLSDFAPGSVAPAPSTLQLDQVSCGVPPTGEVEERRVAFTGRGDTAGRAYFNAAASFPADAEARSYLDRLTAAAQSCPQRLPDGPPAPALGDGTVRLLFPSAPGAPSFVFDALYIQRGPVVALVLVSHAGTTPPPPGDADAFGRRVAGHMVSAGG